MIKNCLKCSKPFPKKPNCSLRKWATSKYCSQSCANSISASRERLKIHVQTNGVWNKGLKGFNGGVASPSWKGGELSKICKMCNSLYTIKRYRNDISFFCSDICRWKSRDQGKSTIYKK